VRLVNAPSVRFLVAALALLSIAGRVAAQDAAVANAEFTTVRLDNERVRVLETTLPPGAREPLHSHPAYLVRVLEGGRIRVHSADGTATEAEAPTGAVLYSEATTHSTENLGETPMRVLLVELKGSPAAAPAELRRSAEEAEVLSAVQQFFDSMAARDEVAAGRVLDPEGDFVSVRWTEDGRRVDRRTSFRDYLESLGAGTEAYLERIWDAEVRIRGPIAEIWAPYDFHLDRAFRHCGIDALHLLRTERGWILTGGTYTVERANCPESPLGPPGEDR